MISQSHTDNKSLSGEVINFLPRKGFGFIRGDDGSKVFVHYSDIRGRKYRTLIEGERVEYSLIEGTKGPQAVDVLRLNPPSEEMPPQPIDPGRTW